MAKTVKTKSAVKVYRTTGEPPNRKKTNTSTPQSRANKTSASAKKRVATPGPLVEAGLGKGVVNIFRHGVRKPPKGASLDERIKYYDAKRAAAIAKRESSKKAATEKATSKREAFTQKREAAAAEKATKAKRKTREAEKKVARKAFAEREKRAQDYKKYVKKRDKSAARGPRF